MLSSRTKEAKVVGSTPVIPKTPINQEACDLIEIRLDGDYLKDEFCNFSKTSPHDILITARDISEGGINDLSIAERQTRLLDVLPYASYIDIEMRNWSEMSDIITEAKSNNITTITSYHDFQKTPSEAEITDLIEVNCELGADILKFAFMMHSMQDLATCQQILFSHPDLSLSIMGMGSYAPASRLLLAQSGSVLNYGYLGEEQTAPGQWPARLLKEAVSSSVTISE